MAQPPSLLLSLYDDNLSMNVQHDTSIGELQLALDRESILNQPSNHLSDSVSLLLEDKNHLSPGVPPNITLTCGLCRAVVLHIHSIQFPALALNGNNTLSSWPNTVHVEIKIGEWNSTWEDKRSFCLSNDVTLLAVDDVATEERNGTNGTNGTTEKRLGVVGEIGASVHTYRFDSGHSTPAQFALSLEPWQSPELQIRVYRGSNQERDAASFLLGELSMPVDVVPGVHKEQDYTLHTPWLMDGASEVSNPSVNPLVNPSSTVSLGFRVLARQEFNSLDVAHHHKNKGTSEHSSRASKIPAASKSHGHAGGISREQKRQLAAAKIQAHGRRMPQVQA